MADAINNPAPGMSTQGPDPNASTLGNPVTSHDELLTNLDPRLVGADQPLPDDYWGDDQQAEPEKRTEEAGAGEEPEFDINSLDEILSGLDVDTVLEDQKPEIFEDPEVSGVFEKIAQAAGFKDFAALQESIREKEVNEKISGILAQRENDLTEEGWDEETVKRQLALDRKELELQAKELKYQRLEAEQKVAKAYKEYPLADAQLLRDFASAAPDADVSAFAKRLHDRSRTIAERSVAKYVAQKAKDGSKGPTPRNAPQTSGTGVARANTTAKPDDSWLTLLGFKS